MILARFVIRQTVRPSIYAATLRQTQNTENTEWTGLQDAERNAALIGELWDQVG